MLSHISITHYALIDELEIDLTKGLNILTGETGSGKSIILGALGLILGGRADKRSVMSGKKKCVVEATFFLDSERWLSTFENYDLDFEGQSIFRREVLLSGKSRAFINDTPVNVKVMRELGMELVDIHSQHQTIHLNDPSFQLGLIDSYADLSHLKKAYGRVFNEYLFTSKRLNELKEKVQLATREQDFIKFQLTEFETFRLDEIDEEELQEEFNRLSNAEEIGQKLHSSLYLLKENESPILSNLAEIKGQLEDLKNYSKGYEDLFERVKSTHIELDDLATEIERFSNDVQVDPNRLQELTELKSGLFQLEQKHGVSGLEELKLKKKELSEKLMGNEDLENEMKSLEKDLNSTNKNLRKLAIDLSELRKKSLSSFASKVEELLGMLNLKKAKFFIDMQQLDAPTSMGIDKVEMMFSANAGRSPEPIRRVASGGELSRLMLAIKKLSTSQEQTIILDEIDSGVSGEVADSMGKIIQDIGATQPVVCITHLPQIASKGNFHFKVYKSEDADVTKTKIVKLKDEDRVEEIAQMLSGAKLTSSARENARELLLST